MADAPRNPERHEDSEPAQAREARRKRAVFWGLTTEQARAMLEDALWRTEQAAGEEPET